MAANSTARAYSADDDLRSFLTQVADVAGRCTPRPGLAYSSPEAFVLRHGQAHVPRPLPEKYRHGAPWRCFRNAFRAALHEGLVYVEGYALGAVIPVAHAWCVEPGGEEVLEVTWETPGAAYLGVPLDLGFVARSLARGACVIDDWAAGWPLLREGLPESAWRYAGAGASMNAKKARAARNAEVERELRELGAALERREDRHGDTKSGWWLDGVFLAPANDPAAALRAAKGES